MRRERLQIEERDLKERPLLRRVMIGARRRTRMRKTTVRRGVEGRKEVRYEHMHAARHTYATRNAQHATQCSTRNTHTQCSMRRAIRTQHATRNTQQHARDPNERPILLRQDDGSGSEVNTRNTHARGLIDEG